MSRLQAINAPGIAGQSVAAYGSIFVQDGSTPQGSIEQVTPVIVENFDTNGEALNTTPDFTNNRITITIAGFYQVSLTISFSGTANTQFEFHAYVDGAKSNYGFHRQLSSGGDVGSAAFTGQIRFTANQVLDVRVLANGVGSKSITLVDASLVVLRIGD